MPTSGIVKDKHPKALGDILRLWVYTDEELKLPLENMIHIQAVHQTGGCT